MTDVPGVVTVVGVSAGGIEALRGFVAALPPDLASAMVIVLHLSPTAPSVLPEIIRRSSPLEVVRGADHVDLTVGRHRGCHARPPPLRRRRHRQGELRTEGARSSTLDRRLFRSAAEEYGSNTIGVLLSGLLDDGVAGRRAIVDAGG